MTEDFSELTDEEIDAIEADKAERTEEINNAVSEALEAQKAENEKTIAEAVAKAVAEALKNVNTSGGEIKPVGTGIHDPNPMKAKIAREKSEKKQVIALAMGYYGERLREEGDVFEVPVDEKGSWFENYKGKAGGTAGEELV